jgi:hypothetical protein
MAVQIATIEDLENLKTELISEIKNLIETNDENGDPKLTKIWLKSHQVQRLLGISPATLQNLRINGTLPYSKVGGVIFYPEEGIQKVLNEHLRTKPNYGGQ